MRTHLNTGLIILLTGLLPVLLMAYPIDGYEYSGIKRLEYYRLIHEGEVQGKKLPSGSLLPLTEVKPRLEGIELSDELPPNSKELQKQIVSFLGAGAKSYSVAILDLSDPNNITYAEHNPEFLKNVGSVGKFVVATALFAKLAEIYPDDLQMRKNILRNTIVTADKFSLTDSHTVRNWNIEKRKLSRHPLRVGDKGSLWEYLDWMISPSSNSAAAMLQKQLVLMSHFKNEYPVSDAISADFFKSTPKKELGEIFLNAMIEPLIAHGIDIQRLRQGSFFTRTGKSLVPGVNSYGNTRELMKLMYQMEKGELVDSFSSTELKRLIYNTERRIRYASHPALHDSAVYFKSGSLYKCVQEQGFTCGKYKGNKLNLLASLAIVETKSQPVPLHYIVVVHSNVLRVNSAVAHQTLGLRIHRMMEKRHAIQKQQ